MLKTGRLDNINSAVIISSLTTLLMVLMMTAESTLSKRSVLKIILLKLIEFVLAIFCKPMNKETT